MNKIYSSLLSLLLAVFSSSSIAEDGGCNTLTFKELNHLPHTKISYPFRVWYATDGKNALDNPETTINDLLLQLHTADQYYQKELGLTSPLQQPRYKQAEYIDVFLVSMEKGNGLAFDEVVAQKSANNAEPYSCGIKMHLNSQLQPNHNITPAHELFHLYQYGNSMFKASWYLEGMARWVEQAFRGVRTNELLAETPKSCDDVHAETYTASRYWRSLAAKKQADDVVASREYLALRYSDNTPIFRTKVFQNGMVVKAIFEALAEESAVQANKNNLHQYRWPEKTQRSSQFNHAICEAVE